MTPAPQPLAQLTPATDLLNNGTLVHAFDLNDSRKTEIRDLCERSRAELASLKAALRAGRDEREALLREAMHTVEGIAVGLAITPVHSKSMCLTRGRASELLSELSTKISLAINCSPPRQSAETRSDETERG